MRPHHLDIAAVPWYDSPESYQQIRQRSTDAEIFFESFEQWLTAAIAHENAAHKNGVTLIRIRMIPAEFQTWLNENGRLNDAESRSEFAYQRACILVQGSSGRDSTP